MNKSLQYKDIILKHKMSVVKSRSECDISTVIAGKRIEAPVFCSNMHSVLNYDIAKIFDKAGWFHIWNRDNFEARMGGFSVNHYVACANGDNFKFVSISVGVKEEDKNTLIKLKEKGYRIDSICIDVALIYNKHFEDYIKWIRQEFPNTYLIAGNCDSREAVLWLQNLQVDCAKIFIGVSSACRTMQRTGFGSTTISDLINITTYPWPELKYPATHRVSMEEFDNYKPKIKILTDGGCTVENGEMWIGDFAKAQRFGADFCMSGKLFANCIDSPALLHGYSGNSTARIKGHSQNDEGTTVNVQSNGLTIKQQMRLVEDSLRSAVSYAGGTNLSALREVEYQII